MRNGSNPSSRNGYPYVGATTAPRSDSNRTRSIVQQPPLNGGRSSSLLSIMLEGAQAAPGWGTHGRDAWLREFYKKESILAGVVQNTASKFASFEYNLDGQPKSKAAVQNVLDVSEHGRGWVRLWLPVLVDYLTQDNGAFVEIIRTGNSDAAPVVGLNHLDSTRCVRTGRWDTPVIYVDMDHKEHLLKWYQVMDFVDEPMPEETARGMQLCAVSRCMRWAQIMSEVLTFKNEKVSGTFARQVNIFNGVHHSEVTDAITEHMENTRAAGLTRYQPMPVMLSALDHRATLSQIVIELASLPDQWDDEVMNRWYCYVVALDFGVDPQDIVPLMGRGLGSGNQSEMLHIKGRGKGAALWLTQVEQQFKNQGITPGCVFKFKQQDTMVEKDTAQLKLLRAQEHAVRIKSGEWTPQVARQISVDEGDLDPKYMTMLEKADAEAKANGPMTTDTDNAANVTVQEGSQPGAANMGLSRKDVRPLAQSGFPNGK